MKARTILDQRQTKVKDAIIKQASRVDFAITNAMQALNDRNTTLAQEVIMGDEEINRLRYEIEQECLLILATQQPAAMDLRMVVAAIHVAVELERIGDYAAGIARLVARLENEDEIASLHKLPKMTQRARKMLEQSIAAFIEQDADAAQRLIDKDEKLDKHYRKVYLRTLEDMRDENYLRRATFLLWMAHNLERIGDRVTNIAERVIFMCTGEFVEIIEDVDLS